MAISVTCGCGRQLKAKDEMAGRRASCPDCGEPILIPKQAPSAPRDNRSNAPIRLTFPPVDEDAPYQVRPEDPSVPPPTAAAFNDFAKANTRTAQKKGGGFFGPEKAGMRHGALGGLAMMVIAAVWFFVALFYFNRIFFYPPILFVFGIFAFFKGLATGNIHGRH